MSAVFRAVDEPAASRTEYWQHVVGEVVGPLELPARSALDARDRLRVGELGAVRLVDLSISRAGGARRARRHIRSSDADLCKIDVQVRGRGVVEQDGRQACQSRGDFTFVDLSRPCRWANSSGRMVAVVFPRTLLPLRGDAVRRLTGVRMAGDRCPGALVSSLARRLPDRADDCDPADAARLATAVLDLLATALAARLDRGEAVPVESRRRALLLEVYAFIDAHLGDPELSPRSVAAAHYVSLRYLHKLFAGERATVAEWIRTRRLERCRRDLLDPALRAEPVGTIGARWGLPAAAQFSRAFRAAYGLPPGEYRASWLEPR